MGIFKTQWVVFQVFKATEKEIQYMIFFKDYWVLRVSRKKKNKEKWIDIWQHISCEVVTYNSWTIATLSQITIISSFQSIQRSYSELEKFLKILALIHKELPYWNPHYEIFSILIFMIENWDKIHEQKLILTALKIQSVLWILTDTNRDEMTQKILKFVHSQAYKDILRLWNIPEETQKKLEEFL
jgi:hypothetical protein